MARKTDGERIDDLGEKLGELAVVVATLKVLMNASQDDIESIAGLTTQVALLQQRVDDMREGWKAWVQRAWLVVAPLLAVAFGFYLNSKK